MYKAYRADGTPFCCDSSECEGHKRHAESGMVAAMVEQHHYDESGSKWRSMYVPVVTPGLKLNAYGRYILPLS